MTLVRKLPFHDVCRSCSGSRALSRQLLDRQRCRGISTYGYIQASCLIFSKTGEPKDVLDLHKHSISPPHGDLLNLRGIASPVNPSDINQIQGTYAAKASFSTTLGTAEPSAVPGNEGLFEVVSAGAEAGKAGLQKGDWVIAQVGGLGTWRNAVQAPASAVLKVDRSGGLSPLAAATVGVNPVTAYRMLADFADPPLSSERGDWIVQNGSNSAVGRLVLQLARAKGIKVIALVRDREDEAGTKALHDDLISLGATKVVSESDAASQEYDLPAKVREWTSSSSSSSSASSGQVRLGLNCVGGSSALALAKVLTPNTDARLVTYGAMSRKPVPVPAGLMLFGGVKFEGFWVSAWAKKHPDQKAACVHELLDMYRQDKLRLGPVKEIRWGPKATREELVGAVQQTLEGYNNAKTVFVFEDA